MKLPGRRPRAVKLIDGFWYHQRTGHPVMLFSPAEWSEQQEEVIVYARQHFDPAQQAELFYWMLEMQPGSTDPDFTVHKCRLIAAVLELKHLSDEQRARLHMYIARTIGERRGDIGSHFGTSVGHVLTAKRLLQLQPDLFDELVDHYGFPAYKFDVTV